MRKTTTTCTSRDVGKFTGSGKGCWFYRANERFTSFYDAGDPMIQTQGMGDECLHLSFLCDSGTRIERESGLISGFLEEVPRLYSIMGTK